MNYFKKILCLILCVAIFPYVNVPTAQAKAVLFSETFNSYVTNSTPNEVSVSDETYSISEYAENEKGLEILSGKANITASFPVGASGDFAIAFDIKRTDGPVSGQLEVTDAGGNSKLNLLTFDKGRICSYNGYQFGGFGNSNMTRVYVTYKNSSSVCTVYINDRIVYENFRINASTIVGLSAIEFSFYSDTEGNGVILDNIIVCDYEINPKNAKSLYKQVIIRVPYNYDTTDKVDVSFGAKEGSEIYANATFDTAAPFLLQHKSNVVEMYKEEDGNGTILFQRKNSSDFHMDVKDIASQTHYVVYEFDIKLREAASQAVVYLSTGTKQSYFVRLNGGGNLALGGGEAKLKLNKWHRISAVYNYYDKTRDIYFDGEKIVSEESIEEGFPDVAVQLMRIHVYGNADIAGNPCDFLIDNVRVYDGSVPKENLAAVKRVIDYNSKKSVYENDTVQRNMVKGYTLLHKRSGVVFANEKKYILSTKPVEVDGVVNIVAEELDKILGVNSGLAGLVSINNYCSAIGKTISVDKVTDINDGMIVIGNSSFKFPSDLNQLKKLNDFAFYYRPDADEVTERYKSSSLYGKHPRIQASQEDFDRIRNESLTNKYMKLWRDTVISKADNLINIDPVFYELRDGVRLLDVCREVNSHMYILGMAYQLTGEQKYVDRAYKDLYAVCFDFPDWHPSHNIDVGEMAAAVAIGYDWMYHGFTPEQRQIIETGIYRNGMYHTSLSYQTSTSAMYDGSSYDGNHNTIINAGSLMMSLAVFDVYPNESAYMIKNAMRAHERYLHHFAPDGGWYEGPSYWDLTAGFWSKAVTTLEKIYGESFGIADMEGLSDTADYMIYMQSPQGVYPHSDCVPYDELYSAEMLWLSTKYGDDNVTSIVLNNTEGVFQTDEDFALAMLFYDTSVSLDDNIDIPLEKYYAKDSTFTARRSWVDTEASFIGLHGGKTVTDHSQLDVGSFIFDLGGVRWAEDPGMGNYNAAGNAYWGGASPDALKWHLFMCRAESHSTISVNPSLRPDQIVSDTAEGKLTIVQSKPRGIIATVDMSKVLYDVNSARRGFFYTDNRQSLVVRDELSLTKESDVYWFLMTEADAEINGNEVILTKAGKKLKLEFVTNGEAEVSFGKAAPLPTSPVFENDRIPSANRLVIKVHGSGKLNITVKMSSYDDEGTPVADYDKNINLWNVPDGDIPTPPSLDKVSINGVDYELTNKTITYYYDSDVTTNVPTINASSDLYNVDVVNGDSLNDYATVIVSDKNDTTNKTIYYIIYKAMPKLKQFDGMTSIPVYGVVASAEPQAANVASMAIDNDMETRWSAEGVGQYIILDLSKVQEIDNVAIAFYVGDTRKTRLNISISEDGISYEQLYSGLSSGTSTDYEFFSLPETRKARYVKIGCDGNTSASIGGWNSISEIVVTRNRR